MQTDIARVPAAPASAENHREPEAWSLTTAEFRRLGVSRLAYVTRLRTKDGEVNYVIHAADGIAVAVVDDAEMVVDLAIQLGVALVTVH